MEIYIYKITNLVNKKIYVGQTVNFEKRMIEHKNGRNTEKNCLIDRSIKKYGWDNFICEIIDVAKNPKKADYLERKYISELNSLKPKGYNILKGGREQQGAWNSKQVFMYNLDGNFIKKFESAGEAERELNYKYDSKGIRYACNKENHFYKDAMFKWAKDNSEIKKYKKPESSRKIKVIQYDLNFKIIKTFSSIIEASNETGTNRTSIISCCKGKYKTAGGFIWKNEDFNGKFNEKDFEIKGTKIMQIDDEGNILNVFPSCTSAEKHLNLPPKAYKVIWKNLDKPNRKAYGFYWIKG